VTGPGYLLDTDTVSRYMRGEDPVFNRVQATLPFHLFISSVTVMELEYGLALNPAKARTLRPVLNAFIEAVGLIPFGPTEARRTALTRARLKALGQPIGPYDLQIAGTALEHGLILVSSNLREFLKVEGLDCEDWRFTV